MSILNKWEATETILNIIFSPFGFAYKELRKLIEEYKK